MNPCRCKNTKAPHTKLKAPMLLKAFHAKTFSHWTQTHHNSCDRLTGDERHFLLVIKRILPVGALGCLIQWFSLIIIRVRVFGSSPLAVCHVGAGLRYTPCPQDFFFFVPVLLRLASSFLAHYCPSLLRSVDQILRYNKMCSIPFPSLI